MIVKVTQEHIDEGSKYAETHVCISRYCPIALALKDTFKVNVVKASNVSLSIGEFPLDELIFTVPTPLEVGIFINNFDDKNPVQPFEFELSLEGVKL